MLQKGSRTQRRKQEQDPIVQAQQILQEKQKQNREDLPSTVAGPAPTLAAEASEELVEDVKDEKSFEEQLEVIKRYLGLNT
jgi:regulator of sirC expression with transglutaminase-like and TPR domain